MTDDVDSPHSVEQVEAQPIGRVRFRAEEVCVHLGISPEILEVCLRWEVIARPHADEGDPEFDEAAMERLRSAIRLHYDLGINWPGVAVILDLLDRLDALERELETRLGHPD